MKRLWVGIGLIITAGMAIHLLIDAGETGNPVVDPGPQIGQQSAIKTVAIQTPNSSKPVVDHESSPLSKRLQQPTSSTSDLPVSPVPKLNINTSQTNHLTTDVIRRQIFEKNRSIVNGITLKQRHEQLENEPIDEKWSNGMEDRLMNFFTSVPEAAQFNIDGITCRTTQCEILLDGNSATNPFTSQQLSNLMALVKKEAWWDFASSYASEGEDATFIIFLQRKPKS